MVTQDRTPSTTRLAGPADGAGLNALMAAAYAPHIARLGDSLPVVGDYADEIGSSPIWIAELGGRMVGALVLEPQPDHMRLANIAVLPDQQGKGIGGALLRKAEEEARAGGYVEMRLFTHAGMPDNVALYERLGWQRIDAEPGSLRVSMSKLLDGRAEPI